MDKQELLAFNYTTDSTVELTVDPIGPAEQGNNKRNGYVSRLPSDQWPPMGSASRGGSAMVSSRTQPIIGCID